MGKEHCPRRGNALGLSPEPLLVVALKKNSAGLDIPNYTQ